jgi:hypothetical protein
MKLEEVLEQVDFNENTDFEGSRTFRIHVSTAKQLITLAYQIGRRESTEDYNKMLKGVV